MSIATTAETKRNLKSGTRTSARPKRPAPVLVPRELMPDRSLRENFKASWSGLEQLPDDERLANVIGKARELFEADAALGAPHLEPGDCLPAWDDLPPHCRATYVKIAARRLMEMEVA